jgi:hypothetical protein
MKLFIFCCTLLAVSRLLEAQLTVPQVGVARFSDGSIHRVHGLAANFIVERRAIATGEGASFSDSAGLTATNGLVQLLHADGTVMGAYRSDEQQPLLNIDAAAQSAAVWLPSKHILLRWDGAQFLETPVEDSSFQGRVTFVSLLSSTSAQFFAVQPDSSVIRISVALPSGRVTSSDIEPGARGSVFAQQGWLLSQDAWGLTAERANGNRQTIQLSQKPLAADDLTMERMSNHWLHVSSRSTGTGWAIYLDSTKLNLFFLPPPVAEVVR